MGHSTNLTAALHRARNIYFPTELDEDAQAQYTAGISQPAPPMQVVGVYNALSPHIEDLSEGGVLVLADMAYLISIHSFSGLNSKAVATLMEVAPLLPEEETPAQDVPIPPEAEVLPGED